MVENVTPEEDLWIQEVDIKKKGKKRNETDKALEKKYKPFDYKHSIFQCPVRLKLVLPSRLVSGALNNLRKESRDKSSWSVHFTPDIQLESQWTMDNGLISKGKRRGRKVKTNVTTERLLSTLVKWKWPQLRYTKRPEATLSLCGTRQMPRTSSYVTSAVYSELLNMRALEPSLRQGPREWRRSYVSGYCREVVGKLTCSSSTVWELVSVHRRVTHGH